MSTRKWSLIAILPVLASAIVLSIVVVRMVTSDPSESPSLVVDEDEQIEPVGNNPSSFVDEAPKLPVEVDVARSQLIVVGSKNQPTRLQISSLRTGLGRFGTGLRWIGLSRANDQRTS